MFLWKVSSIPALAATLLASVAVAAGASPLQVEGRAEFTPIQSISYSFGSKSMSGYFVQDSATCVITLMISENRDPDHLLPVTPTRLRLVLNPGQIAGLDSEEGRSLNMTCGDGAATLLVDVGQKSPTQAQRAAQAPRAWIAD